MAAGFEANGFAVDAGGRARAAEVLVSIVVGTFESVIFGKVMPAAEWADNCFLVHATTVSLVTKVVASVTLSDKGKRCEEFDCAGGAIEEKRLGSEAFQA